MTRIAVLGNQGRVTGGMIVWVGGELAYGYGRELDEIPPTDWDVMSTDGLTYRMLESRPGVGGAARRRRRRRRTSSGTA